EHTRTGFFFAARFVETKVTILAETQYDSVQPAGLVDAVFVLPHTGECICRKRTYSVELSTRDVPRLCHTLAEEVGAVAGFVERHTDIFVENKNIEMIQLQMFFGDATVKIERRVAGGDHDIARGGRCQPCGQEIGGCRVGPVRVWVTGDFHP